jgi:hypothetical protein
LALTSPTSGGRSVGILRWRTEVPEFKKFVLFVYKVMNQYKNAHFYPTLCALALHTASKTDFGNQFFLSKILIIVFSKRNIVVFVMNREIYPAFCIFVYSASPEKKTE